MQDLVRKMLSEIGENPDREGLLDTPKRVVKSLKFLTEGYEIDPQAIIEKALFDAEESEMVIVKDIEIYSMCEHHLLPFFGKCHIAYIPNGKIVGLSKLPRVVDVFSRRLQVQERLTSQIANAINKYLNPLGVGVIIEASHFCMMMRGVQKQNSQTITSCMLGEFRDSSKTRNEFLKLTRK